MISSFPIKCELHINPSSGSWWLNRARIGNLFWTIWHDSHQIIQSDRSRQCCLSGWISRLLFATWWLLASKSGPLVLWMIALSAASRESGPELALFEIVVNCRQIIDAVDDTHISWWYSWLLLFSLASLWSNHICSCLMMPTRIGSRIALA